MALNPFTANSGQSNSPARVTISKTKNTGQCYGLTVPLHSVLNILSYSIVFTSSSVHFYIVTLAGDRAAAMVAADIDEGAGEGWGEDAALVIDEGTRKSHFRKVFF